MTVRKARFAGSWYPGDRASLKEAVEGYIATGSGNSKVDSCGNLSEVEVPPAALIVPHAGYVYSAAVAGSAFAAIRGHSYRTVIVLAPSHRIPFEGVAVWAEGAFSTPLGTIPVDESFAESLISGSSVVSDYREPHIEEHSLEMELPFLQYLLTDFQLVPLIIGGQSRETVSSLAALLDLHIRDRDDVLIVASTDLSHFHDSERAEKLDRVATDCIEKLDSTALMEAASKGRCELCGLMPVSTVLSIPSFSGGKCEIMQYTHSGHITGDNSSVVGYLSAVIS